jgi:arylsulfatase
MAGRKSLTVYQGMTGMSENAFINIKNQSHSITAYVEVPKEGADGVLLAQGGRFGGWTLYVKGGKPVYTYNWLGLKSYSVASKQKLAPGNNTIRFEFGYDGGGAGKGGPGTLLVNGKRVAQARIEQTECCTFSVDEGADVGRNDRTAVTEEYKVPLVYSGVIEKVTITLDDKAETKRAVSEPVRQENKAKRVLSD